jgi:hypothetical protein
MLHAVVTSTITTDEKVTYHTQLDIPEKHGMEVGTATNLSDL